ncbi:hypothetical protein [Actinoplanes subtropicus]|uniref:hypothetical protein n=1 Tax=Actinoplanes subtropicus TaxID=543632 RepID=UPI0012F989D6|nr:hypothetical protein [Actinoplanes subtropicus]
MPELEAPRRARELYLAREDHVNPLRPHMTGDVFQGVQIPGVTEEEDPSGEGLVMVLPHPCSMREGPTLRKRILVARVARTEKEIPFSAWRSQHISIMPLPELLPSSGNGMYAVIFDCVGRVPSEDLKISRRVATLSEYGIALMQQRRIFSDTRELVEVDALILACEDVLLETELAEDWNEEFVDPAVLGDDAWLEETMRAEAQAFFSMLHEDRLVADGKKEKKFKLSDDIKIRSRRPLVKRAVEDLIIDEKEARSKTEIVARLPNGAESIPARDEAIDVTW